MDKIILYKNDDGEILQATDFEPVDRDDLIEEIDTVRARLRELQDTLAKYDSLAKADPGTDTETPPTLRSIEGTDGNIRFIKTTQTPPAI